MASKRLFVDSDVILDLLTDRQPFSIYAELLFDENKSTGTVLGTSALVIANLNYILTRVIGKSAAKQAIKQITGLAEIFSFEKDAIESALNGRFSDFEDAIQSHIAIKNGCDAIITRNIKDYKQATIPVMTAEQYLRTLL